MCIRTPFPTVYTFFVCIYRDHSYPAVTYHRRTFGNGRFRARYLGILLLDFGIKPGFRNATLNPSPAVLPLLTVWFDMMLRYGALNGPSSLKFRYPFDSHKVGHPL